MIDIRGLAYVVAEARDLSAWRSYAEGVLGMMSRSAPGGELLIKMDEREFRILVQPGPRDAYVASGWEVQDQAAFAHALSALHAAGVKTELAEAALCDQRHVQQLVSFRDPSGNRHEIVWGFKSDFAHFASPAGVARFITQDLGMGHAVLPAPSFQETEKFFCDVMGFAVADRFNFRPGGADGPSLPIHFLHCNNGRHHSLALAGFPVESGCVHLMVEVADMAEVGRAMDRMAAHGARLSATLGQHTNDKMTSFYMRCPSNFDIEFGYGGKVCDWNTHIAHEFTKVSLWGHDFSIGQQGGA